MSCGPRPSRAVLLAVVVALGAALVTVSCGGEGDGDAAPSTSTPAARAPSTEVAPRSTPSSTTDAGRGSTSTPATTTLPATTGSPPTSATGDPTTTPASATTVAVPADAPTVTPDDAALTAAGGRVVAIGPGSTCRALARAVGGSPSCGTARTGTGVTLAWLVDEPGTPAGPVTLYRVEAATATPVLSVPEAERAEVAGAHVEAADLDGRRGDEVVVGVRRSGTGGFLDLDVVAGDGEVVAHRTLDSGRAEVAPGVVRTWEAQYGPDDPNCCPGSFRADRLVAAEGRWRLVLGEAVAVGAVPAGQFP